MDVLRARLTIRRAAIVARSLIFTHFDPGGPGGTGATSNFIPRSQAATFFQIPSPPAMLATAWQFTFTMGHHRRGEGRGRVVDKTRIPFSSLEVAASAAARGLQWTAGLGSGTARIGQYGTGRGGLAAWLEASGPSGPPSSPRPALRAGPGVGLGLGDFHGFPWLREHAN